MTKKELAINVAKEMNRINPTVNIEETANLLKKQMLASELEKALNGYRKQRQHS